MHWTLGTRDGKCKFLYTGKHSNQEFTPRKAQKIATNLALEIKVTNWVTFEEQMLTYLLNYATLYTKSTLFVQIYQKNVIVLQNCVVSQNF